MAKVDWYSFAENFQAKIQAAIPTLMCSIEEAKPHGDLSATIFIKGRRAPDDMQTISAYTRTRYLIEMQIWVAAWSLEGFRRACEIRDDTIGSIEDVLQDQANWSSFANAVYLDGGELETATQAETGRMGYYAGGTINFRVDATHTR